ncbi:hypothetical protein [Nonomuraea soli]|uniref:TraB/GumN family protein n=1 Tax=Nonomuraea soli TaxID=1032476 RepID=A0A7W0HW60_9ACTN|nr:hypothetical protein [Nonomuraea soli]MBA2897506.1 hypothetical protein [Nonomuraea soli]
MRFIESSDTSIRSSVITFRRPGTPMQFVLFPMVHIAEPAFYEEVTARLKGTGLIVAEGYPMAEMKRLRRLAEYRLDDLVDQVVAMDIESLGIPILWPEHFHADTPPSKLDEFLSDAGAVVTWLSRVAFPSNLPDIDDTSRKDQPTNRIAKAWNRITVEDRDRELISALGKIYRMKQQQPLMVAVLYGAYHMTAVAEFLTDKLGYQPVSAEWLTVRHT